MTMPDPAERRRSTAVRRTRLAWRRTALATAVVGLLAARLVVEWSPRGAHGADPRSASTAVGWAMAVTIAVLGWTVVLAVAHRRVRTLAGCGAPITSRCALVVVLVVLGYAALGAFLVTSHGR